MSGWLRRKPGKQFCHCLCCQLPLVEIAEPWLVNKEISRVDGEIADAEVAEGKRIFFVKMLQSIGAG